MLQLTSTCELPNFRDKLSIKKPVFLAGSCFAEHIGERIKQHLWKCTINPNGILFNPISVLNALEQVLNNHPFDHTQITLINDLYFSWEHHGLFHAQHSEDLINNIEQSRNESHSILKESNWIILSLGSAWVYELHETKKIVANCHKAPAKLFTKRLLTIDEIVNKANQVFHQTSDKQIILTVSPVKYFKDGITENNLSKATLLLAVNELCQQHRNVHYFPAYEIITDELRDYRFYQSDRVHPTEQAIDHVFDQFKATCLDNETLQIMSEIHHVILALNHRPIQAESKAHDDFITKTKSKMEAMKQAYPFLDWSELHG